MRALRSWLWNSTARNATPLLVLAMVLGVFSRRGWEYEWNTTVWWAAGTSLLLGTLVGGLAAFDRARRARPTLATMETTSTRGWISTVALPLAHWLTGYAAWLMAVVLLSAWAGYHDAAGTAEWLPFAMVAATLLFAACVGAAVGQYLPPLIAGPAAGALVYATGMPDLPGLPRLTWVPGSPFTATGLRGDGVWSAGFIAVHVLLAAAALMLLLLTHARTTTSRVLTTIAALALVGGAFLAFMPTNGHDPKRPHAEEIVCFGTAPALCGPESMRRTLERAAPGFADAYTRLQDSGLALPERFTESRASVGRDWNPTDGSLSLVPQDIDDDGHMSTDPIVSSLTTPVLCQDLFGDEPPTDILAAQSTARDWFISALAQDQAPTTTPQMQAAWETLTSCTAVPRVDQ